MDLVDSGYRENVKNVLIVDEIQNIDGWELAVRDLIAKRKFDIYLTGSNSNLLSSEYATHLGGRYNRIRMLPLSYRECVEFATAFGLDGDVLERYMRLGGFPINWISDVPVRSALQTVSDIADVIISVDISFAGCCTGVKELISCPIGSTMIPPGCCPVLLRIPTHPCSNLSISHLRFP